MTGRTGKTTRKGQFFIITTILISGALFFISAMFMSTADIDHAQILRQHEPENLENIAGRAESIWWDQDWTYRTTATVTEQDGAYLEQQAVPITLPARRGQVLDTCNDIRVIDNGEPVPWIATTACNIDTYRSDTNAVARYKLDEGSGQWANDSTGNGNDGELQGDPQWVSGRHDGGLLFDGSGDYVDISHNDSLNPGDQVTVSLWFNPVTISPGNVMRLFQRQSGTYGMWIDTNGELVFYVDTSDDGGSRESATYSLPEADRWYHALGTYNGNNITLYVDGGEEDSTVQSRDIDAETGPAAIGGNPSGSQFFDGRIDDIRIYDFSMTAGQADGIYRNGIGLNVSVNATPHSTTELHIYHGNPFAADPNYSRNDMTYTINPDDAVQAATGIPRKQEEATTKLAQDVDRLNDQIGASIEYIRERNGCDRIELRSTQTVLEQRVC